MFVVLMLLIGVFVLVLVVLCVLLIGLVLLVLIVELLNLSVEVVIDCILFECYELLKCVKDFGSVVVMVVLFVCVMIWGFVFGLVVVCWFGF